MWSDESDEDQGRVRKRRRRKRRSKQESEEEDGPRVELFERKERTKKGPKVPAEFVEGEITRIAPQKRDTNRASLYIDGKFAFGIMQAIILEFSLSSGQVLSAERQREILARSEFLRAKAYALEFLSFKQRSVHELRERLLKKEFEPAVVEKTVVRFIDLGYLNDARFARAFAREKVKIARYGKRRVLMDLRKRGLSQDHLEGAFDELCDEDYLTAAREAAQRRWARVARESQGYARLRKVTDFLARRGFDGSTIRLVVDELKRQAAEEDAERDENESPQTPTRPAPKERPSVSLEEAWELAEKRLRRLERSEPDAFKRERKLWDHLRRKGCTSDVIREVCARVRAQAEEEEAALEAVEETPQERSTRLAEEAEREEEAFEEAVEMARSRMRKLERLEKNTRKREKKLQDFLMRRGVSWEWIRRMRDDNLWAE